MEHKEVKPVSTLGSSSSSTMDDVAPQSLFVVVSYNGRDRRYFSRILQLDPKAKKYEYVAHFEQPQGYPTVIRWVFSNLPCSPDGHLPYSPEDLCMVPDWGLTLYQKRAPLLGFVFNLRTKELNPFKPPGGARYYEHVVDLGEHTYFMGAPKPNYEEGFFFASYNRLTDSWKSLEDFPYDDIKYSGTGLIGFILATAVWDNTILLTMEGCGMWAYDVCSNKWYPVYVHDFKSDDIVGKAVVLEDTIYALAKQGAIILALSIIKSKKIKGGLELNCSLLCRICVPGTDVVKYDFGLTWLITRDLVHLGGDNFCIVESCSAFDDSTIQNQQPIQVTYLKKHKGKNLMTVQDMCVLYIELLQNEEFKVELCFTLPEDKATAFKEGNRFFAFDPFPEHYVTKPVLKPAFRHQDPPSLNVDFCSKLFLDNDSLQTNMIDEQGCSIKATNIPPGATVKQNERLEKSGPINSPMLQVVEKNKKFPDYDSSQTNVIDELARGESGGQLRP